MLYYASRLFLVDPECLSNTKGKKDGYGYSIRLRSPRPRDKLICFDYPFDHSTIRYSTLDTRQFHIRTTTRFSTSSSPGLADPESGGAA